MHEVWAVKVVCNAKAMTGIESWCQHEYEIWSRGVSFMRCLVVVHDEGWAVCVRWPTKRRIWIKSIISHTLKEGITRTRVYISFLPAYSSFLFSSGIIHTSIILNKLHIMWLAQNNASRSKTHPITYTTLYFPSGLPSATCNCIIMFTLRM